LAEGETRYSTGNGGRRCERSCARRHQCAIDRRRKHQENRTRI